MSRPQLHHRQLFVIAIAMLIASSATALAQTPAAAERRALPRTREIPEATLPCSAEESKWWEELRQAGKTVQDMRGGKKEQERFLGLLRQGQEKAYQLPIPDRKALILSKLPPRYTEAARRKLIKGSVSLSVELRPDGFVGEAKVTQRLERGLDQNAIDAARHTVFLPAVKDRKFVSSLVPMMMSFDIY